MSADRTRVLTFRYVGALVAVALFLVAAQVAVQAALDRQQGDARVVNIAGRQRMLSQRLCMLLLAAQPEEARETNLQELARVADEWDQGHDALLHPHGDNSATVQALFAHIESDRRTMLTAARDAVRTRSATPYSDIARAHQDAFLDGMDRIVAQYESEARERVVHLRRSELVLLLLALGVLVLEGVFVFRPGVRSLRLYLAERDEAQRALVTVSDAEQRRIARDLHDGLTQELVGVSYLVKSLATTPNPRIDEVERLLGQAIEHSRGLARSLYSATLEEEGLVAALRDLAAHTERVYKVDCHVHADEIELPAPQRGDVYRIAREAVLNAARHAHATVIDVELVHSAGTLTLVVRDDGVGMTAASTTGLGLHLMQSRANIIGAALVISPGDARGTVVTCTMSLPANRA